jgi:hypothetical protein
LSEALREQQDTIDEFSANIADQERDYKSRLIEVFGYPYAGDIGAGKTYPSGYDGPDIYHYMYVNTTELTGASTAPSNILSGFFAPFADGTNAPSFYFGDDFLGREFFAGAGVECAVSLGPGRLGVHGSGQLWQPPRSGRIAAGAFGFVAGGNAAENRPRQLRRHHPADSGRGHVAAKPECLE